jgi:hypothetical protein
MAVSAFMEFRDRKEDSDVSVDGPHVISREVFQFSYNEAKEAIEERFEHWLNDVIVIGLDQWRRQL